MALHNDLAWRVTVNPARARVMANQNLRIAVRNARRSLRRSAARTVVAAVNRLPTPRRIHQTRTWTGTIPTTDWALAILFPEEIPLSILFISLPNRYYPRFRQVEATVETDFSFLGSRPSGPELCFLFPVQPLLFSRLSAAFRAFGFFFFWNFSQTLKETWTIHNISLISQWLLSYLFITTLIYLYIRTTTIKKHLYL